MFERLQKPFLTVETGEAYQPIRLTYTIHQLDKLINLLNSLKCCEKNPNANSWHWFWRDECANLPFESLEDYVKNTTPRLGTFTIREGKLYLNLSSFKRACLAVPFIHRLIASDIAEIHHADFINKVFGTDERLPHGFAELFKEDELEYIVNQRIADYKKVQHKCEEASTAEEAIAYLANYNQTESQKRLPYAERYVFEKTTNLDVDVLFLSFYIFLRGRELVAIRRWFGNTGYTLADAADETVEMVFGGMNIDFIE